MKMWELIRHIQLCVGIEGEDYYFLFMDFYGVAKNKTKFSRRVDDLLSPSLSRSLSLPMNVAQYNTPHKLYI